MARSKPLLKLLAILLFLSFFSLFVQNAVAAPLTAVSTTNIENFQDGIQTEATQAEEKNHPVDLDAFNDLPKRWSRTKRDDLLPVKNFQERTQAEAAQVEQTHQPDGLWDGLVRVAFEIIPKIFQKLRGTPRAALRVPLYPDLAACERAINTRGKPIVFYSNSEPKDAPIRFAMSPSVNGVVLSTALPRGFLLRKEGEDEGGRLHQEFLERVSLALSNKSKGDIYFVTSKAGPKPESIWTKIEEPALKANLAVNRIIKVDSEKTSNRDHNFWVRG